MTWSLTIIFCMISLNCIFASSQDEDYQIEVMARSILNDKNLGIDGVIKTAFMELEKAGMDILLEPDPTQCIKLLETTGIIELVYGKIVKSYPLYNEAIMNKMIGIIGKQLCINEVLEFQKTKDRFYRLSEHLQNEVTDEILNAGNQQNAWTAESYSKCIDTMNAVIQRLSVNLKQEYPKLKQLKKFKKLLVSIIYQTCDSYFKDKRDL